MTYAWQLGDSLAPAFRQFLHVAALQPSVGIWEKEWRDLMLVDRPSRFTINSAARILRSHLVPQAHAPAWKVFMSHKDPYVEAPPLQVDTVPILARRVLDCSSLSHLYLLPSFISGHHSFSASLQELISLKRQSGGAVSDTWFDTGRHAVLTHICRLLQSRLKDHCFGKEQSFDVTFNEMNLTNSVSLLGTVSGSKRRVFTRAGKVDSKRRTALGILTEMLKNPSRRYLMIPYGNRSVTRNRFFSSDTGADFSHSS